MNIYQLVFGIDSGQVSCAFHNDERASAGIGPSGEYNCFACGAKAHNELGFIKKYFRVGDQRAQNIQRRLMNIQKYKYVEKPLTPDQIAYVKSIGISDEVRDKYLFNSHAGRLIYGHKFNGVYVGYTWFNHPSLTSHNATYDKYKYDKNNIAGMLSPYDTVISKSSLIITEGEKDMLVAKSFGIGQAVTKVGGAKSYIIGGENLNNKEVVIIYDCDDPGREGAQQDAQILATQSNCKVRIVDLGLQNGEDLTDYFMKYNHTAQDLVKLIKSTPYFVPAPVTTMSKVSRFIESLTSDEYDELINIIEEKQNKGDHTNGK